MSSSLAMDWNKPSEHALVGAVPLTLPAAIGWLITYLLAGAAVLLLQREAGASFWYPPVTLGILMVSLYGWRAALIVLLADPIVSSFQFGSPLAGTVVGVSTVLEASLAAALLARARVDLRLPDVASLLRLFTLGAVVPTFVGVTHGSLWLLALGVNEPASAFSTWLTWWFGDAATTTCLLPMLLITAIPRLKRGHRRERPGALAATPRQTLPLVLIAALLSMLAFGWGGDDPTHLSNSLKYLCFLPVIWAAITLGVPATSGLIALTSTLAVILTLFNGSPAGLAIVGDAPAVLDIQLFMLALGLGGMGLALALEGERAARATSQRDAAALRASETRLRQVLQEMPVLLDAFDADGAIIVWNHEAERITGYSADEIVGNPRAMELLYPEATYRATMLREWASRGHDYRGWTWELAHRDGGSRTIAWSNISGRVRIDGWASWGVGIDITEQRRAEDDLRAARALLASVVEHVPANVFVCDLAGHFQLVNRSWERYFRYERDAVIGKHAGQVLTEQVARKFLAINQQVIDSDAAISFEQLLTRDGQTLAFQVIQFPIRNADGPVSGVGGIALDITERTRAEQARRLLSAAQEQAGEGTVITDAAGTIRSVNPAFERISGYSAGELVGRTPAIMKSEQHDDAFYRQLWATISGGEVWRGRFVNRARDGREYTVEATIAPIRGAGGVIEHYVAVERDVTRELRLEAQFRQAQKMEAIGRLAGGIAHDFNNLLSVINGYSELLLDDHLDPDDPVRRDVEPIREAGRRAASLTRQLLVFSRHQSLQPETLDLNRVLAETEKLLRRLIGEDIEVVTQTTPELWSISVDRGQLEQVIMNLVVNARDAMPAGGTLRLATSNVRVESVPGEPGEYVRLEVSDTGVGMSAEALNHLFEPFYTTKEQGRGTGLGLATVHGIVTKSGGTVAVSSILGRGSHFTVDLPRHRAPADRSRDEQRHELLPRGSETILLVEDEEPIRILVARILRAHGYSVLVAAGGAEALEHLAGPEPIQLILTDVVMPEMSGPELAAIARRRRPELAVLLMSGYPDRGLGSAQEWDPDAPLLAKPLTPAALCTAVRLILDQRARRARPAE